MSSHATATRVRLDTVTVLSMVLPTRPDAIRLSPLMPHPILPRRMFPRPLLLQQLHPIRTPLPVMRVRQTTKAMAPAHN